MTIKASWAPSVETIQNSNIYKMMQKNGFEDYLEFWRWSVDKKSQFWEQTVKNLDINFHKYYTSILDISRGVENAQWLKNAKLNIVDSCFQNDDRATSIIFQEENGSLQKITQDELKKLVNRIANGIKNLGLTKGDYIGIDMPMTYEAVAIYLAGIKAGNPVVTIADSFTTDEIKVRLKITNPKILFTQGHIKRTGREIPLYQKVIQANPPKTVVLNLNDDTILRKNDLSFSDFLSDNDYFESLAQDPDDTITVLFSSGTTGEPKAIPWTHTTPIKSASDGHYHQDIQTNNVVCWPTNLGWMMGPWLVFATLINKATIALYYGAPVGKEFGEFVQNGKVSMLGVIPSFIRQWKTSQSMDGLDWNSIRCFSSTGEVSNPSEMKYLMALAGNKPIIEYCGGTEVGGGYIASTMVQKNIASCFSTQALGGEFLLLDEDYKESAKGEIFIIPPIMGLSNTLINKDHFEVYYAGIPKYHGKVLRRHGDRLEQLENGYFKMQGRVDDAMNLGGIKVSSIQIEEVVNQLDFIKESAAIAVSPIGGGPSNLLIYYVEKSTGTDHDKRLFDAKQIIKTKLNPLFKVSKLVLIDQLPRTASGKVMRRKLRTDYEKFL